MWFWSRFPLQTKLLKASAIKSVFTTIEKELVLQKLGKLSDDDLQKLRDLIPVLLG